MNTRVVNDIANKKISIIGYGISGIGAAHLALYLGAKVFISEKNTINKSDELIKKVSFEEGNHTSKCYDCDFAIVSPGIDTNNSFFENFKKKDIPIISEIEFASWFSKSTIIGITGSNGKSTTVSLLYNILVKKYKEAYLGGNIGTPFSLNVLKEITNDVKNPIHILELSSFQLENICHFKPDIASILNLSNDHLDRYPSIADYYNAKKNILKNMNERCYFIYNLNNKNLYKKNIFTRTKSIGFSINNEKTNYYLKNNFIVDKKTKQRLLDCTKIKLIGTHNIENILVAIEISKILGINNSDIEESIYNFLPLEHRMEKISTKNNISFINDSKSTNPDSTIRAILCSKKNTILILGGYSKGKINYGKIFNIQFKNIKTIVCYGVEGKIIYKQLKDMFKCLYIENFEEAAIDAIKLAKSNYRVLLSPACSSFDQFNNFKDRGNKFKKIVKKYFM